MAEVQKVAGYENAAGKLVGIKVADVSLPEYALREAQTDSPEFLRLKDDIGKKGLLFPILVKELPTSVAGNEKYGLIDGLQRFTIAKSLGWETIPAMVLDLDEAEIAETQIIANAVRVTTTPAQFSTQLRRILNSNPTLTRDELAKRLSMSVSWLDDRLSLNNLTEKAAKLVDEGRIQLSKAFALAKLPKANQDDFLEEGCVDTYPEFSGKIEARLKEIRAANRAGNKVGEREFVAVPHLRKLSEIEPIVKGDDKTTIDLIINQSNPQTIKEAVQKTLEWCCQLDPQTVAAKKAKDEQIKAERAAKQAAKNAEQSQAKLKSATERVAELTTAGAEE